MKITKIFSGGYASNCYALISDGSAFVVDPSAKTKKITETLAAENAVLSGILLTHGHFDHLVSLETLRANGIPVYIHGGDSGHLADSDKNGNYLIGSDKVYSPAEILTEDDMEIIIGKEKIRVIHTPGHTKGSVCYLSEDFLITGDTLFSDTVGRTDLYGGNFDELCVSIKKLNTLDGSLRIYPGHGPSETLKTALITVSHYFN